ncbi:UDP-N-acetylmuramoyl-L-alanine--D-glutamate ligase, partial [Myxococcota bacterium]|nr:UDP-N-acetylmuramoyl-L-alanine--D-glutamate ligase [Myxococcota bacterium]
MDLSQKSVLVLGLGLSGRSAATFCGARGADVVAADERPRHEIDQLETLQRSPGIREVRVGASFPDPSEYDITIPSPGVPESRYRDKARIAWGDIELAGRFLEVPIIAVTGTNGKSTTVKLIESMLRSGGRRAQAAGNVGTPALSLVGAPIDLAVLEVSSFQLEATERFQPKIAAVLNLSPDHLDRHGTFQRYGEVKQRILAQQEPTDIALLSFDDQNVRAMARTTSAEVVGFSLRKEPRDQKIRRAAWLDAECALLREGDHVRRVDLSGCRLRGAHNRENLLAALTTAWLCGVEPDAAAEALASFRGLPHRSERVSDKLGLEWIDDSKATNPGAAIRALEGLPRRVIWIAGGRGKGLSFDALAECAAQRTTCALLVGESAAEIEEALAGRVPSESVDDVDSAVARAAEIGRPGDIVLLAPGCSSLDQFNSFEERGLCFQQAI